MDSQQVVVFDKLFTLIHEGIKLVLLVKVVDELSKAQDETVRQNLSLALGALLNLGPHMNRFYPEQAY